MVVKWLMNWHSCFNAMFVINCLDKDKRFFLTWPPMFVRFHWPVLTVINAAYSTDIPDRSVKSSKHCWEQVRKSRHRSVKFPNIVNSRSEKTTTGHCKLSQKFKSRSEKPFPQIKARMINLPAELGRVRAGFHWPTFVLQAGLSQT